MAYQLKTTGIAAHCTMCIAVDPDTGTIKDFASSAVTADMTVGAGITFGEQAWDGVTRKYFKLASGNYVAFGTNKPNFTINPTPDSTRSVVWIGEVAGSAPRVFGGSAASYFAGQDSANGGATHPYAMIGSVACGATNAAVSAGQKKIFGWSLDRNTASGSFIYTATDTDSSGTVATKTLASSTTYSLSYIGRRNDSTTQQADKIHAVLIFNTNLTEADFDSLRDDWFGVLLESGGATDATADGGTGTGTGSGSGGSAAGQINAEAAGGTGTGTGSGSGGSATGGEVIDGVAEGGTGIGVGSGSSGYIGILAEVIAAETAEGEYGPGILYNEAMDPTYAGKYLRAVITTPPAVGTLTLAKNGKIEGYDLPVALHTFYYDLYVNDVYDSSSYFEINVVEPDAAADGGTGIGTGSGSGGNATGEAAGSASGGTGTGSGSGSGGDASGQINAEATGGTGSGTGSGSGGNATGEVGGSATASGGTGTGTGSGTGGNASGQVSAEADGGTGTGAGAGSGGDAAGGSADAVASGGTGAGVGAGSGGTAIGGTDLIESGPAAWWVRPLPRCWIIKPNQKGEVMPLPCKDPEEIKTVTFDFSDDAESLTEATITPTVAQGLADATPGIILGSQSIVGGKVNQRIQLGNSGTSYALRCKAIDADGEVHVAVALLPVKTAVPL